MGNRDDGDGQEREGKYARSQRDVQTVDAKDRKKTRKPNRGITDNIEFIETVALSKYRHEGLVSNRSISRVARDLRTSESAVRAADQKAHELGIVYPLVIMRRERSEAFRLEHKIKQQYHGLREVMLVEGPPAILDKPTGNYRFALWTQVIREMALRVAEYLDAYLARFVDDPNGPLIGCAWGRTLDQIAHVVEMTPRAVQVRRARVKPVIGGTLAAQLDDVEANVIASKIARAIGGRSEQLLCPAVLSVKQSEFVINSSPIREVLQETRRCGLVLTGIGPSLDEADGDSEINLVNDPKMSRTLLEAARSYGAIGEICGSFFKANGEEVETEYHVVGLGYKDWKRIAADPNRRVLLITGGDAKRFVPLKVALKAGLASALVTDTITARFLVGELDAV